jgi:hypothetical protein
MTNHDSNNQEDVEAQQKSQREKTAAILPFLIRAWWLRDFEESRDITWPTAGFLTGAIWSQHSDPLVDAAGMDYPEPF